MIVYGGRDEQAWMPNDVWALPLAGTPSWTRVADTNPDAPHRWDMRRPTIQWEIACSSSGVAEIYRLSRRRLGDVAFEPRHVDARERRRRGTIGALRSFGHYGPRGESTGRQRRHHRLLGSDAGHLESRSFGRARVDIARSRRR